MKRAASTKARFLIVAKSPRSLSYVVPSSISPQFLDIDKFCQVLLRFDPVRANHHPDDNDILLTCSPELYAVLREGMHGVGVWEKKRLLEFTPEEERS